MMTFSQRFTTGVELAKDSVSFFNKHKKLILYSFISTGIALCMERFLFSPLLNLIKAKDMQTMRLPEDPSFFASLNLSMPATIIVLALAFFVVMLVVIYFDACLVYHAAHDIRNQPISIKKTLVACLRKWPLIAQWAALITVAMGIALLFGASSYTLLQRVSSASPSLTWLGSLLIACAAVAFLVLIYLATYLVVPLIALQNVSLLRALRESALTVKQHLAELMGGLCVVYGVYAVASLVLALLARATTSASSPLFNSGLSGLNALLSIFIAALVLIFKAFFYDKYYEQRYESFILAEHDLMF